MVFSPADLMLSNVESLSNLSPRDVEKKSSLDLQALITCIVTRDRSHGVVTPI
jgi:hypothetical protein